MWKVLFSKLKEALTSVLPVTIIVVLLNLTPLIDLSGTEMLVFLVCAFFLILGIGLFNLGADLAMTPMGEQVGSGLAKSKNLFIMLIIVFMLGLAITISEPDLSVLASQVSDFIDSTTLIITVGIGTGIFLILAVLKIIFKVELSYLLMFFYMLLFALTSLVVINGNSGFLALAFDAGGVTTGPITSPLILALGVGIARTLGGKDASENSFGLLAMCSVGPIIMVMILGITASGDISYSVPDYSIISISELPATIIETAEDVGISLGLVVFFFIIIQVFFLKLPWQKLIQIFIGILYTFFGLVIFLTAVTVGFMPIGYEIGMQLAESSSWGLVIVGLVLGMVVVFAEPAVRVLTKQTEDVTNGLISRRSMLFALSIGVGISLALSMIRIIFDFNILYYLIPGYCISLGLSLFVPKIYTAVAFDAGGVASGPLTSTFILPMAVGACIALQGPENVLSDAFGIVAMVAMTPLITIQLLGFSAIMKRRSSEKHAMRRIMHAGDDQIIDFM